ncbi:ABC transporter substrate-binding protein [Sessilibacter corallicola]|uniref:ABC transporter substrate-binding protein n=1 Tax=Sessilibacter corallicola TaxID=2904075 RepID=A0ABQ0AA80_9GAMM
MYFPSIKNTVLSAVVTAAISLFSFTANSADNQSNTQDFQLNDWSSVENASHGGTLYFNTWGGEPKINRYIQWLGKELKKHHNITVKHVKLADTAEAISRIIAEKQANNTHDGSVDLIWINGENFSALKSADLLYGPWAESTPNFYLTNPDKNPAAITDFTVPTEGYELPWGKAQLIFFYDASLTQSHPRSISNLLQWAKDNPGQFTYPKPPQFLGTTFLKQALIELVTDKQALYAPVKPAEFTQLTAPLFDFLDALHPHLWRKGKVFPNSGTELKSLMADGELSLGFSFSIQEVASSIANYELPESVMPYTLDGGTLGNYSFLAIPFNSPNKAAALVAANFLLSPQAQARKQDPSVWGSSTVIDLEQLNESDKKRFQQKSIPGIIPLQELPPAIPEPHPSWVELLEQAWLKRYQS